MGKAFTKDARASLVGFVRSGSRVCLSNIFYGLSVELTFFSSICLARGRPYAVPIGPLVESCDTWHISDIADRWDGSVISAAVLRRDVVSMCDISCFHATDHAQVSLITGVRDFCDGSQGVNGGSTAVRL